MVWEQEGVHFACHHWYTAKRVLARQKIAFPQEETIPVYFWENVICLQWMCYLGKTTTEKQLSNNFSVYNKIIVFTTVASRHGEKGLVPLRWA